MSEGIVVSSTTDSKEQIQDAIARYGFDAEPGEVPESSEGSGVDTLTDNEKPPESFEAVGPDDKSAAAPGAAGEKQEPKAGEAADAKEKKEPERDDTGRFKASDVTPGVQKRIDKAVAKQREAERERDELKRRLEQLEAHPAEVKQEPGEPQSDTAPTDNPKPQLADYESYDEFMEALTDWKNERSLAPLQAEIATLRERLAARDKAEAEERARAPITEAWDAKVLQARENHADYDEVLDQATEAQLLATPAMQQELLDDENGAEVAYYLASHPEECERIMEETNPGPPPAKGASESEHHDYQQKVGKAVRAAAREIGRISALVSGGSTPEPKPGQKAPETRNSRPSNAPPPVKTVGTRSAVTVEDPGKMTPSKYREWRDSQKRR